MTDFIQKLVDKYGKNVAYFQFENFLVLNKPEYLSEKTQISNSTQNTWNSYVIKQIVNITFAQNKQRKTQSNE